MSSPGVELHRDLVHGGEFGCKTLVIDVQHVTVPDIQILFSSSSYNCRSRFYKTYWFATSDHWGLVPRKKLNITTEHNQIFSTFRYVLRYVMLMCAFFASLQINNLVRNNPCTILKWEPLNFAPKQPPLLCKYNLHLRTTDASIFSCYADNRSNVVTGAILTWCRDEQEYC